MRSLRSPKISFLPGEAAAGTGLRPAAAPRPGATVINLNKRHFYATDNYLESLIIQMSAVSGLFLRHRQLPRFIDHF